MKIKDTPPITKEQIIESFNKLGIKTELINTDKYGFSRDVSFIIYDTEYVINWWVNQSYLHIGRHQRSARIPFKYILYNNTYPLIGGNNSIVFVDELYETSSIFEREYPFSSFYIPIEIKQEL